MKRTSKQKVKEFIKEHPEVVERFLKYGELPNARLLPEEIRLSDLFTTLAAIARRKEMWRAIKSFKRREENERRD